MILAQMNVYFLTVIGILRIVHIGGIVFKLAMDEGCIGPENVYRHINFCPVRIDKQQR